MITCMWIKESATFFFGHAISKRNMSVCKYNHKRVSDRTALLMCEELCDAAARPSAPLQK